MEFHRPEKHSLTINGHRTSVSLEPTFWSLFCAIASNKSTTINNLAADIDKKRGSDCGLAAAIRLYVLEQMQETPPST